MAVTDYRKQHDLIDVSKVDTPIHVIGAGSLGSWLTFFLLKMGFKNINVYDFDQIEEHNLPNQFYRECDIGDDKVSALFHAYEEYFDDVVYRLRIHSGRLDDNSPPLAGIILCAVDTMHSRKELYETLFKYNAQSKVWIEGRLSVYGAYVYSVPYSNMKAKSEYEKTFYDDAEAEVSACGISQTALPSAVNAASVMVMQMIEYLNGNELTNAIEYSIPWIVSVTKKWSD